MGYTKIVQFVKTTEVYFYEKKVFPKKSSSKRRRSPYGRHRSQRSIKRARKTFFNLCKNELDARDSLPHFLTLTYHNQYEAPPSFADSSRHFNVFFKRAKALFGEHISYIAVPEYQTRGYLHYHALVWGFPKSVEQERATRILQRIWRNGFADVRPAVYKSDALAGYLAKYFTKTYGDYRFYGRKAYTASRNINRPKEAGTNDLASYLSTFVESTDLIATDEYDTPYLGRTVKHVYQNKLSVA